MTVGLKWLLDLIYKQHGSFQSKGVDVQHKNCEFKKKKI